MRKWFVFFLMLFSPLVFAFSEADLVALLQKPQTAQGNFTQKRFLKALNVPIQTEGLFVLAAKKGLLWEMQQPFASRLRVTPKGIDQWDGQQWRSSDKLGQSDQIQLFLGLLSGDLSGLKSQFDMHLSGNAQHWQLELHPSSLLMKQIFTEIHITGDNTVQSIYLHETQGDQTLIEFSSVRLDQPLLPAAQEALK